MDLTAQAEHGGLKAQAGAGRGLEEQGGQDLPVALVGVGGGVFDDVRGLGDELVDLLGGVLQNVNQAFRAVHAVHITCYLQSSFHQKGCPGRR